MSMVRASLLLVMSALVAAWVSGERAVRVAGQIVAAAVVGGVPAVLMFDSAKRQNPISGTFFVIAGFAVGILAGGFGAVMGGDLQQRRRWLPWIARLGGFLGAAGGTWMAFLVVHGPDRDLDTERYAIAVAAALVGALATLGYQVGGGGAASDEGSRGA